MRMHGAEPCSIVALEEKKSKFESANLNQLHILVWEGAGTMGYT